MDMQYRAVSFYSLKRKRHEEGVQGLMVTLVTSPMSLPALHPAHFKLVEESAWQSHWGYHQMSKLLHNTKKGIPFQLALSRR